MNKRISTILDFVARYSLWLLSVAGGFYLLLRTRTTVLMAIAGLFNDGASGPYKAGLVDKWGMIVMAIGLIVAVGAIEYVYSRAKDYRDLLSRFLVVTGIELLVLAGLDAVIQAVIGIAARNTFTVMLFIVELGLGILMVTHRSWWRSVKGLVFRGSSSRTSQS